MSGNATGDWVPQGGKDNTSYRAGNITNKTQSGYKTNIASMGSNLAYGFHIDVSHTHNVYVKSSDSETRPVDFTYKVWVRTA